MTSTLRCVFFSAAVLCLSMQSTPALAAIDVDATTVLRAVPDGIGGTVINAHSNEFATNANGINYQSDLAAAHVGVVRNLTFPDPRNPLGHTLSYFDANFNAIVNSGAAPLLIQPIDPPGYHDSHAPSGANVTYYSSDGKLDGTGTVASNVVYLTQHYLAAHQGIPKLNWEIGNEPDSGIDYAATKEYYSDTFNSIHAALVNAGLRDKVSLAGPAISYGYHLPFYDNTLGNARSQFLDYFLQNSKDAVDVVTTHMYAGNDTPDNLLNKPQYLDTQYDSSRTVVAGTTNANSAASDRGLAALQAKMATIQFGRNVTVGVTEHNVYDGANNTSGQPIAHSITAGIWNLAVQHFLLADPKASLDTTFVYDDYGTSQGGYGVYDANKTKDPVYWSLWIAGNLRGDQVLSTSTTGNKNSYGNSSLLVNATRDSKYLYLEVLNRSTAAIVDMLSLANARVQTGATIYTLSSGATPDVGLYVPALGTSFPYDFAPTSDTIFRYTLIPEPSAVAWLGVGAAVAFCRPKRKKFE